MRTIWSPPRWRGAAPGAARPGQDLDLADALRGTLARRLVPEPSAQKLALNHVVTKEAAQHVMVEPLRQLNRAGLAVFDVVRRGENPPTSSGPLVLGYGSHFGLGQFERASSAIMGNAPGAE